MLVAALEFVMQFKVNSSKNSVRTRLPWNQSGQSESFVLYFKPYAALRRLSIYHLLGQDAPRSSGESGGSSVA